MTTEEPTYQLLKDPRPWHVGWASADLELWYRQDFELYSDGRIIKKGELAVSPFPDSLRNVKVTDTEGKEMIKNAKPRKEKEGGCGGGCGKGKNGTGAIRWLGVRWAGIPMPVRYLRRWFTKDAPAIDSYDGCGCIIKLKVVWFVLQGFARLTVVGSKRVWAA